MLVLLVPGLGYCSPFTNDSKSTNEEQYKHDFWLAMLWFYTIHSNTLLQLIHAHATVKGKAITRN